MTEPAQATVAGRTRSASVSG
ncbi:MAG: hypothetical protein QOC67_4857, partial [Pseudonocardiales bacterium]|nr:hypothetical protein [Pseudonocardiales bacterium]